VAAVSRAVAWFTPGVAAGGAFATAVRIDAGSRTAASTARFRHRQSGHPAHWRKPLSGLLGRHC